MGSYGIHHRLYNDFTAGYGFDAIAVALLGKLHPIGVLLAALFFGALRVGASQYDAACRAGSRRCRVCYPGIISSLYSN